MGKVLDFLFPRERIFFKMLNDAAENVMRGVIIFSEFVDAFSKLNSDQKKDYLKKIEGKTYYYIVEGKLDKNGKVKQKVILYLGNIDNIIKVFNFFKEHS